MRASLSKGCGDGTVDMVAVGRFVAVLALDDVAILAAIEPPPYDAAAKEERIG